MTEHGSPQPWWDILTGGPGKPGWPWKPCGETRAEPDPNSHILPDRGPGGPRGPLGDAHLVPLLTGAAWEPTLAPRPLRREGVRWVGGTVLHPQPPTLPWPHPPGSRSGWAPTAGPVGPGRPSKPGGPWEGEERDQMDMAGRTSAPVPTARGAPGRAPSPSAPSSMGPQGLTSSPFSPGGPT